MHLLPNSRLRLGGALLTLALILGLALPAWADRQEFMQKGQKFFDEGKYREASIEFRNALKDDARFPEAHYRLGLTYLKLGDLAQAYRLFFNTVTLDPDNLDAQVRIGQISLLAGRADEATERAELVLKQKPKDVDALILLGQAQAQRQDSAKAQATLKQAMTLAPERADIHVLLGQQHSEEGRADLAEQEFSKAIELSPKLLTPQLLLVRLYLNQRNEDKAIAMLRQAAQNHPNESRLQLMLVELLMRKQMSGEAESALRELVARYPNDERYRLALGRFYTVAGQVEKAEQVYQEAVRQHPESMWPLLMTAGFYASRGDSAKALSFLDQAAKVAPKSPVPQNALSEFDLERGRLDQAQKRLEATQKDNPADTTTQTLLGRLAMARNDLEKAISYLTAVIRERPEDAEALYRRSQAFTRQQKPQLALADLNKAIKSDPTDIRPRFLMAALQAQAGELGQGIAQMDQVLQLEPKNLAALDLRGRFYLAQGTYAKAEADFQALVARDAASGLGYHRLGMLAQTRKQPQEAVKNFEEAMKADPNNMDSLMRLAFLLVGEKQTDRAIARVKAQMDKTQRKELVHNLLGDLYQVSDQHELATKEYQAALGINPNLITSLVGLAAVDRAQGKVESAVAQLDKALKLAPDSTAALVARGDVRELAGREAEAEEDYRAALTINNEFVPALNNLAYLLSRRGGDKALNEALPLIQRAKRLAPNDPRLTDTMGWVLFQRGSVQSALQELEDAVKQMPDNPAIHYHLAVVQSAMKNDLAAKASLKKALSLPGTFREKAEAMKLQAKLGSN